VRRWSAWVKAVFTATAPIRTCHSAERPEKLLLCPLRLIIPGTKTVAWWFIAVVVQWARRFWALAYAGYVEWGFYLETASFAPGAEIRPMLVCFKAGMAATGSVLLGGACALYGLVFGLKRRRWLLSAFSLTGLVATWVPLFADNWIFHYIVAVRRLVLED
jgi:hypothetical protein